MINLEDYDTSKMMAVTFDYTNIAMEEPFYPTLIISKHILRMEKLYNHLISKMVKIMFLKVELEHLQFTLGYQLMAIVLTKWN